MIPLSRRAAAEFIGTFWLVLGGCGSAVLAATFPDVGIGLVAGVGKHSLVLALARRIAEGKGPANLKSVVQLNEHALVDDDFAALEAGLKAA